MYTFLNQRFKNAAIEQVEFTFGEGSIAHRLIESYLRSRSHTFLNQRFKNAVNRPIENAFGIGPIYQPIH